MKKKYGIKNETKRKEISETLKQQLQTYAGRLKRFQDRKNQFYANYQFENFFQQAYRQLRGNKLEVKTPLPAEEINAFWRELYEKDKKHNDTAQWLADYRQSLKEVTCRRK